MESGLFKIQTICALIIYNLQFTTYNPIKICFGLFIRFTVHALN